MNNGQCEKSKLISARDTADEDEDELIYSSKSRSKFCLSSLPVFIVTFGQKDLCKMKLPILSTLLAMPLISAVSLQATIISSYSLTTLHSYRPSCLDKTLESTTQTCPSALESVSSCQS